MWKAGNIGGELLNWIVLLGVVGKDKPRYLADHDEKDGHAYAVWRWRLRTMSAIRSTSSAIASITTSRFAKP